MTTVVVDVRDLAPGQTRAVEAAQTNLLVCRAQDGFYAIENQCPHQRVRLDGSALRGHVLECGVHGGTLDVRDGSPLGGPIRRPVATFAVRDLGDGTIEIDPREP